MSDSQPSPTPPDDSGDVRVASPPAAAGGAGALLATVAHLTQERALVRGTRALLAVNQSEGFDCPGCAWPDPPEERSATEFCENGAKAVAWEATTRRADAAFFARHSVAELAAQSDYWLGQQGRLVEPLLLRAGDSHYRPLSWDDAFSRIADELNRLPSADHAALYTSGRTSNEAAYLWQLFARQLGTNNLPDCSNMCHESSGLALRQSVGVGKGSVQLEDFALADVILVWGQNPGTNHPRMLSTLQAAARRGCRIVSINPLAETALTRFRHPQNPIEALGHGTPLASLHVPVRVNGDVGLIKGVCKGLLEEEARRGPGQVLDRTFLDSQTDGFAALAADLAATTWTEIEASSGVARALIDELTEVVLSSRRIIACWAMGLTQHRNAVANIRQIVNLLLLRGSVGIPGAGFCPVRGHSNVQGDRTMGIWEAMDDAFLDRLGREHGFSPPRAHGLDTVGTIEAMRDGRVCVFLSMGGNFLSATPDTELTAAGLRACALTVQISTKLNRAHLVTGHEALILPCLGRTERDVQRAAPQFVTVENSMSVVHRSQGVLAPASPHLRSEPAIVAGIAQRTLGARSAVPWTWLCEDYDRIRECIARVVPGFEDFNDRVRTPGGFVLPNPARQRRFPTATGKARLAVTPLPRWELAPDELLMMTIRSHDQYNTTVYGLDDRYRGISGGRRVVLMNAADLEARALRAGDVVDLESRFGAERRHARRFVAVPFAIPPGCAATYFPEANILVALGDRADGSRTPSSKSVVITVSRSGA